MTNLKKENEYLKNEIGNWRKIEELQNQYLKLVKNQEDKMKIYNTLSQQRKIYSIEKNKVRMYVCGPAVYLHPIGNARPAIFFDTVRRYFEYKG